MENDKITEGIKQMAEMLKNAQTERKAQAESPNEESGLGLQHVSFMKANGR